MPETTPLAPAPLPPPIRALIAQARGAIMQLDAIVLSLESFGQGMMASAARQQAEVSRQARDTGAGAIGPVFGAPRIENIPISDDTSRDPAAALARLDASTPSEAAP